KNIELNRVDNAKTIESNLYDAIEESFDFIISNPPIRAGKQIVHGVIKEGFSHLNKCGIVYVVIQKKQGAESLKKVMEKTFGNVSLVNKNNGYMIYKSVKEM
ncbi:MAG: methyltransferase, partial [Bacilli bacterium]|nr:methyltransferase [Bacilli bacterium]